MYPFNGSDRFIQLFRMNGDFYLELRFAGNYTFLANIRMSSVQRPPGPHHVGIGKTGVIIADMTGIHTLKSGLKSCKVRFGDEYFELDII